MELTACFKNFLAKEVNLNQARIDQLDDRVAAISAALKGDEQLGPLVIDVIAQGSFAHKTIIKPLPGKEFDADLLLQLADQQGWQPKDYVEAVYAAFRRNPTYERMVSRRTRCVLVDYANEFHVDVVPYLERNVGKFITNRKENVFERTNPEGFTSWLDEQNRIADGHLVPVIRPLKYLRDYKGTFSVKSIILTTLLGTSVSFVKKVGVDDYYGNVPRTLVNVCEDLDAYLQANTSLPLIADPSCPGEDFNHRWDQAGYSVFRERFHGYTTKMRVALDEPDEPKSLAAWRDIFGDDFQKLGVLAKASPTAPGEQFIEDTFPIALRYDLKIVGRVEEKPGFRSYDLTTHGNRVGKGRSLLFRIARCNVPEPYEVLWKARNRGDEAAAEGELRGSILEDAGARQRRESTKWRGDHYVDCYIVKGGRVVARDRQRVRIV